MGKVKAVIHRIPDDNWIIKSATVSQESDGRYYISVLFEFDKVENTYIADKTNAIGLDYASDGLYVDSNGNVGTNHKYTVKAMINLPRHSADCLVCKALKSMKINLITILSNSAK